MLVHPSLAATVVAMLAELDKAERDKAVPVATTSVLNQPVAKRCEFCGRFTALAEHSCVSCGAPLPSTGMSALDLQRVTNRWASRLADHCGLKVRV